MTTMHKMHNLCTVHAQCRGACTICTTPLRGVGVCKLCMQGPLARQAEKP